MNKKGLAWSEMIKWIIGIIILLVILGVIIYRLLGEAGRAAIGFGNDIVPTTISYVRSLK
jgi:hypothetical protein